MPIDAAGGLVSTVRDLARLDAALDPPRPDALLADETLAAAWTPAAERGGVASPMGLGWFVQSYKGERIVWHFGYVLNGYSSLIVKVPARSLTFILLANGDGLSAPFQLQSGDVTRSLFATLFLRLASILQDSSAGPFTLARCRSLAMPACCASRRPCAARRAAAEWQFTPMHRVHVRRHDDAARPPAGRGQAAREFGGAVTLLGAGVLGAEVHRRVHAGLLPDRRGPPVHRRRSASRSESAAPWR